MLLITLTKLALSLIRNLEFFYVCRFAYVEFTEADAVELAKALDESLFRGRQIKVGPGSIGFQ